MRNFYILVIPFLAVACDIDYECQVGQKCTYGWCEPGSTRDGQAPASRPTGVTQRIVDLRPRRGRALRRRKNRVAAARCAA